MSAELSDRAHAAILLRVAARTVSEARQAWTKAQAARDVPSYRLALRACVLATRAARRAADAYGHDTRAVARLTVEAAKLNAAAEDLKTRLALKM